MKKFHNQKPNVAKLHIYGSICFAYKQNPKKLDPRSKEGIFIGYDMYSPAYLVYFPEQNDLKRVRNVKFSENNFNEYVIKPKPIEENETNQEEESIEHDKTTQKEEPQEKIEPVLKEKSSRYPKRDHTQPKYLNDHIIDEDVDLTKVTIDYCYHMNEVPLNYQEAIHSKAAKKWKIAMDEEMKSLESNHTFQLTPLPEDQPLQVGVCYQTGTKK